MAKARASLASVGIAKTVEGRTSMDRECRATNDDVADTLPKWGAACCAPTIGEERKATSWDTRRGFWAPPPETMSCWILCLGRTKRWTASAMDAAVTTVAVWMRSFGFSL